MDYDFDGPETETVTIYYISTSVKQDKNPKLYFI